jgi:hypothetical protein
VLGNGIDETQTVRGLRRRVTVDSVRSGSRVLASQSATLAIPPRWSAWTN